MAVGSFALNVGVRLVLALGAVRSALVFGRVQRFRLIWSDLGASFLRRSIR